MIIVAENNTPFHLTLFYNNVGNLNNTFFLQIPEFWQIFRSKYYLFCRSTHST